MISLKDNIDVKLEVIHTPDHTEDSVLYYSKEHHFAFVVDTIFLGSIGNTQYPGGSEIHLQDSIIHQIFVLPDETVLYSRHLDSKNVGVEKSELWNWRFAMSRGNESIKIGNVELNGRIIMPPVGTYKADANGYVTEDFLFYYKERAKNPNVAMIITEYAFIDKKGKARVNQLSIAEDTCIPGLKKLVDTIHAEGTSVFAQLNHAGAASPSEVTGEMPIAPSAIVLPTTPAMGDPIPAKEMTKDEINEVVDSFIQAARRAKEAGYDGIEIHSAHAYLLNQFYSSLTNKRTDEYGGTLENRLRLHREVLRAVRAEVGDDYQISVRLGGYDEMEGGNTLADAVEAAKILAKEGIQLLSLTGGMCRYVRKGHTEPGYFSDMSIAIRKEISVPILLTGGVKTLNDVEELLEQDVADLIGVGRQLLANASWQM